MMKLVVGLTGGIGTGKSTALRAFAAAGAATISLDEIAHELTRKGSPACRRIARAFGPGVIARDGSLDRRRLSERVFARPSERRRLERITHQAILREMKRSIARARRSVVVVDVPLLFEGGHERRFDLTLVVAASPRAQVSRVRTRDRLSASQARARIAAQWPIEAKKARADVVVGNDGSRRDLRKAVRQYEKAFSLIAEA